MYLIYFFISSASHLFGTNKQYTLQSLFTHIYFLTSLLFILSRTTIPCPLSQIRLFSPPPFLPLPTSLRALLALRPARRRPPPDERPAPGALRVRGVCHTLRRPRVWAWNKGFSFVFFGFDRVSDNIISDGR